MCLQLSRAKGAKSEKLVSDSMEGDLKFGIESKSLNSNQTLLGHAAGGAVG